MQQAGPAHRERMYKFRLKQWGVAKYIKQRDMGGVSMGTAAHPAAADASLLEDYPVDRHEGAYGQGDGAGTHMHGRYHPFVHSQLILDGSISDVRLQLTEALPGAPKTDGSWPPPPCSSPRAYRPPNRRHVLAPMPPSWPYPATLPRLLAAPGGARVLDICVGQLQRFVASLCDSGLSGTLTTLDGSPEKSAERIWWTLALGKAVNEIHVGHLAKGFRQLNAVFAHHQFSLVEGDAAFFLKLTTALALLSDQGLTGVDALFLRYISSAVSVVIAPSHPFAVITRQLQALGTSSSTSMAWYLLTMYSDMVWGLRAETEQRPSLLSQLSWDMSRCVDIDYAGVLSKHPSEWGGDRATTALLVAQVQITQRMYGAARRTLDHLLAQQATVPAGRRSNPAADDHDDALIVALALRKHWDISRAAGGDHEATCRAAAALIHHCRTALGPAHHATTRAIDEHESYLRARRAADGGGTTGEERQVAVAAVLASAGGPFVRGRPPDG